VIAAISSSRGAGREYRPTQRVGGFFGEAGMYGTQADARAVSKHVSGECVGAGEVRTASE